jgi:Uma2 family endonuclease
MAAPVRQRYSTPEEYLAHEREAAYKSEYIAGQVVAMSGVSREHSLINGNLFRVLSSQLLDRPCEVHASDMRVKVSARGLYTYPDIAVVCGDTQYEDDQVDTLLNPTLIVEVLSPSTEAYDRGVKFGYYRQLPSLREYLLVAQDRMLVEHFVREDDGWLLTETTDPGAVVRLPSINCEVPLAEIYRKIVFSVDSMDSDQQTSGPAKSGDNHT